MKIKVDKDQYYQDQEDQDQEPQLLLQEAQEQQLRRLKDLQPQQPLPCPPQQSNRQVEEKRESVQAQINIAHSKLQQLTVFLRGYSGNYRNSLELMVSVHKAYLLNLKMYLILTEDRDLPHNHHLLQNLATLKTAKDRLMKKAKLLKQRIKKERVKAKLLSGQNSSLIDMAQQNVEQKQASFQEEQMQVEKTDSDQNLIMGLREESASQPSDKQHSQDTQEMIEEELDDGPLGFDQGEELYRTQKLRNKDRRQKRQTTKNQRSKEQLEEHMSHGLDLANQDEGRKINYIISKNKGMTRVRNKIQKNSRVKFRQRYEKAMKKAKMAGKTARSPQFRDYMGEATGIRAQRIRGTAY